MSTTNLRWRKTIVGKLIIGEQFKFIPTPWYGAATLRSKERRELRNFSDNGAIVVSYIYDLMYDAPVINPPGLSYGVPGDMEVLVLK